MKTTELSTIAYVSDPTAKPVASLSVKRSPEDDPVVITIDPKRGIFSTGTIESEFTPTQWAEREERFKSADLKDAAKGYVDITYIGADGTECKDSDEWVVVYVKRRYRRLGSDGNGIGLTSLLSASRYRTQLTTATDVPSEFIQFGSFASEEALQKQFLALAAEHYKDAEDVVIKVKFIKQITIFIKPKDPKKKGFDVNVDFWKFA